MEGMIEKTCANCRLVAYKDIMLLDGTTRPYAGGLVNCHKGLTGRYPHQHHNCPEFELDVDSVSLDIVIRKMEREWNEEKRHHGRV